VAALIGLLSQKGDVGKGALARLRVWDPAAGWHVKIVDLDFSPASTSSKQRSECAGLESDIAIESFGTIAQTLKVAQFCDLVRIPADVWSLRYDRLEILKNEVAGSGQASGAPDTGFWKA